MERYNITINSEITSTVTIVNSDLGVLSSVFATPDGDAPLDVVRITPSRIKVTFPSVQALREYSGSNYTVSIDGDVTIFGEVTIKNSTPGGSAPGVTIGTRVFVSHTTPPNPRQNDLWIEVP